MENQVQTSVVTEKLGKTSLFTQTMRYVPASAAVVTLGMANAAQAADFSLDMATLLVNIGVVVAAVTAVGLAALSLALTVKSFKYVKSAF